MTAHLVQFSTGAGSAEVAFRVQRLASPGDRVELLTADTMVEDADNWRFAYEVVAWMLAHPGAAPVRWMILADGRTPMEVGRDHRVVPNDRMAVCSRVLKRELLRRHIDATFDPADTLVHLGFDWTEGGRIADAHQLVTCSDCKRLSRRGHVACDAHELIDCQVRPARPGAAPYCGRKITEAHNHPWAPYALELPLLVEPLLEKAAILDRHRSLGIEPCRLYAQGFSHANCGGACVRGGHAQWELLHRVNPARYAEWEAGEAETAVTLGRKVTILTDRRGGGKRRPMSLREFRERLQADPTLFDADDWGACGCLMDGPP